MFQVDATITSAKTASAQLDEIWNGQPSLADHPKDVFVAQKKAVTDLIAAAGLEYPVNVTVYFTERVEHPDAGSGSLVTPGAVQISIREVLA